MNVPLASLLGIASSIISAIGLFFVFRVSVSILGEELVGIWVLIQSLFFFSRIAEGGVGINLTRIYAIDLKTEDNKSPFSYYLAGVILVIFPVAVIGLLLVDPAKMLLINYFRVDVDGELVSKLVWLCYLTAVLNAFGSVGLATIEGAGKLAWRHMGTIVSNIVFIVVSYPMIDRYGVLGLPMLYVLSISMTVMISCIMLWVIHRSKGLLGQVCRIVVFIWRDSLRATGMVLLRGAFEPWTKFLVGSVGSLGAVAAAELAFRVTAQVRVLIQSATQPLLFIGARNGASMPKDAMAAYTVANYLVIQVNWGALAILSCAAPIISILGFGYLSTQLVFFVLVLSIGNTINSMGVVGYYAEASGSGLSRLLRIHFAMMIINVIVGMIAGWFLDAIGPIIAYAISFTYGGIALLHGWASITSSRLMDLMCVDRWVVTVVPLCFVSTLALIWVFETSSITVIGSAVLTISMCCFLMVLFTNRWRHLIYG